MGGWTLQQPGRWVGGWTYHSSYAWGDEGAGPGPWGEAGDEGSWGWEAAGGGKTPPRLLLLSSSSLSSSLSSSSSSSSSFSSLLEVKDMVGVGREINHGRRPAGAERGGSGRAGGGFSMSFLRLLFLFPLLPSLAFCLNGHGACDCGWVGGWVNMVEPHGLRRLFMRALWW